MLLFPPYFLIHPSPAWRRVRVYHYHLLHGYETMPKKLMHSRLFLVSFVSMLSISTFGASLLHAQPVLLSRIVLQEPDSVAIRTPTSLSISESGQTVVVYDGAADASAYFFRTGTGECTGVLIADKTPYLLDSATYYCRTSPCSPWIKPEGLVTSYTVINPNRYKEETGKEIPFLFAKDLQNNFIGGTFVGETLFMKCDIMTIVRTVGRSDRLPFNKENATSLDTSSSLQELNTVIEYDPKVNTVRAVYPLFTRDYFNGVPIVSDVNPQFLGISGLLVDTVSSDVYLQTFNRSAVNNKRFSDYVNISGYSLNDCGRRDVSLAPLRDSTGERAYPDEDGRTPTLFARDASGRFFYLFDRGKGIYDQQGGKTPVGIAWKAVSAAVAKIRADDHGRPDTLASRYTYSIRHEELRVDSSGFSVVSMVQVHPPTSKDLISKGALWCLQRYAHDGTVLSIVTQPEFRSDRSAYTCRLGADARVLYCVYLNKATEMWELDTYDVRR